jgi:integrase
LESRTARLRLAIQKKPYSGPRLARGIILNYRRCKGNGTWEAKVANGHGGYWTKKFGQADDLEDADGTHILSFHAACDAAKALARGGGIDASPGDKPMTVADALTAYKRDLKRRGKDEVNASRVVFHLAGTALASKPVGLLTAQDLQAWQDGLIDKMEQSSVVRTGKGFLAALRLAAKLDRRIQNKHEFGEGLGSLPDANKARGPAFVLPNRDVLKIVRAAYEIDRAFGLLVEVLAVTGARKSQVARHKCVDLQADRPDPRLMMPASFKGRKKEITKRPVPITSTLAAALKKARGNRSDDSPLLLKSNGTAWQSGDLRYLFGDAATCAGFNPRAVTSYALRHSSIVRALLGNVPIAVVAQQHDTSVAMIEKNYAAYILDHSDALSRRVLLDTSTPPAAADNVVTLPRPVS